MIKGQFTSNCSNGLGLGLIVEKSIFLDCPFLYYAMLCSLNILLYILAVKQHLLSYICEYFLYKITRNKHAIIFNCEKISLLSAHAE